MDQQTSSVQLPEHLRIDQKYVTKGTVLMSQSLPGWGQPTHPEETCSLLDHPLGIIKYPVWVSPDRALTIPTAPGTGSQEDREGCPSPCPLSTEIHGVTPQPWFPQSALNKSSTTSHRLCLPPLPPGFFSQMCPKSPQSFDICPSNQFFSLCIMTLLIPQLDNLARGMLWGPASKPFLRTRKSTSSVFPSGMELCPYHRRRPDQWGRTCPLGARVDCTMAFQQQPVLFPVFLRGAEFRIPSLCSALGSSLMSFL